MGDNSKISYRQATSADAEKILKFYFEQFLPFEPTSVALGVTEEDVRSWSGFQDYLDVCVSSNMSYMAFDESSNNKVVGMKIVMANDAYKELVENIDFDGSEPQSVLKEVQFDEVVGEHYENLIPRTCEKLAKSVMICVHSDYRRRGIAVRLNELVLENAMEHGFDGIVLEAISKNSQNLFRKLQFDVLKTVFHKYYLDENGQRMINCADGTDRGELMFKWLIKKP